MLLLWMGCFSIAPDAFEAWKARLDSGLSDSHLGACESADILFLETFDDGDYTSNPPGVAINPDDARGYAAVVQNELRILRDVSGGNGGSISVVYDTLIPVTSETIVKFDVKPTYSDVINGCGNSCGEYPINVRLTLLLDNSETIFLQYSYGYQGSVDKEDDLLIRKAFGDVEQDAWLFNEHFRIYDSIEANQIVEVIIFGSGWDFEGYVDNLVICQPDLP